MMPASFVTAVMLPVAVMSDRAGRVTCLNVVYSAADWPILQIGHLIQWRIISLLIKTKIDRRDERLKLQMSRCC